MESSIDLTVAGITDDNCISRPGSCFRAIGEDVKSAKFNWILISETRREKLGLHGNQSGSLEVITATATVR